MANWPRLDNCHWRREVRLQVTTYVRGCRLSHATGVPENATQLRFRHLGPCR